MDKFLLNIIHRPELMPEYARSWIPYDDPDDVRQSLQSSSHRDGEELPSYVW